MPSQVPGCLANAMSFLCNCCKSPRRTCGTCGRARELDPTLCLGLTLLPNTWKEGLPEEGDTKPLGMPQTPTCLPAAVAGWWGWTGPWVIAPEAV